MVSEKEILIAFIFKRSGKSALSFSDLYLTVSVDLNWSTPDEAKKLVNDLIENNFLIKKDDKVIPNFDINKIEIPVGFIPSKKIFLEEKKKDIVEENLTDQILKKIIDKTGLDEDTILKKIKEIETEKNILFEVGLLFFAKMNDVELSKFYTKFEEKYF